MTGSTLKTYNGLIPQMRQEGYPLQTIADKCGVTKQWIHTILKVNYPNTVSPLINERKAARLLGCPPSRLAQMRLKGLVSPVRRGYFWIYDTDELEKAMLSQFHPCAMCGQVTTRTKYCIDCAADRRRNRYPFLTVEGKKRARDATAHWAREHPQRVAETARVNSKIYYDKKIKQHWENTTYIVTGGSILPLGTEVKAVGFRNWHYILASGEEIHVMYLKKKQY